MDSSNVSQSESVFRVHWKCWRFLGHYPVNAGYLNILYYFYAMAINVLVTFSYPTHLLLGLFKSETTQYDVFKILAISLPCLVCSIKSMTIWWNLYKVREIEQNINKLNLRVHDSQEVRYYLEYVMPAAKRILYLFYFICLGSALTSEVSVIITGFVSEWRLMYPAYFPFDPYSTILKHVTAHMYQILGISVQILQNLINDTYGGMRVVTLAGHIRMLGMRVARIGFDAKDTPQKNNQELLACIQDHKDLLAYHGIIGEIISWGMFAQIIFTGINMCVVIIYIIFFMDNVYSYIYYTIFLFAIVMEIFPCCYYGTVLELELEKLTYAIHSCNWIGQSKEFKMNLRIFAEQSLKPRFLMAGNMFRINLNSFFVVCRAAYSLFAVIMQVK